MTQNRLKIRENQVIILKREPTTSIELIKILDADESELGCHSHSHGPKSDRTRIHIAGKNKRNQAQLNFIQLSKSLFLCQYAKRFLSFIADAIE